MVRVKRSDGSHGWIFGGFLQKKAPELSGAARDAEPGSREFAVPTTGKVSSKFGYRVHPVTKKSQSFHSGIDIFAPKGTKVNATADGVVKTASYNNNGYGNLVILEHEKELSSYYAHLEKILVTPGPAREEGGSHRDRRLNRHVDRQPSAFRGTPRREGDGSRRVSALRLPFAPGR